MAKTILVLTAACVVCAWAAGPASAETYKVSDIETLAALVEGKARPGDVIEVQPGTYMLDRPRLLVTSSGTPEAPLGIRGKGPVAEALQMPLAPAQAEELACGLHAQVIASITGHSLHQRSVRGAHLYMKRR